MESRNYILAIEAAVAGGSIALFDGPVKVASRPGDTEVSRAEMLLVQISEMLTEAGVEKDQVGKIAVSLGPGSFTGIRIGIATALGLKNALGIAASGFSVLEALAVAHTGSGEFIVGVPVGKSDAAWQRFDASGMPISGPVSDDLSAFLHFVATDEASALCLHTSLSERLGPHLKDHSVIDVGTDLASAIALAAASSRGSETLDPIYLRNSRYTGIG